MKTPHYLIALILAVGLLLPSCGTQPPKGKSIGVSLLTRAHLFYRDLESGLRAEADSNKYDVIVTAAEFDLGKQTSQIEDFIARKVDAIVVCPVDSRGIGAAIKKANEARIPVFTADIAAQESDVMSHIASDNIAGGRLAGEYLATHLGKKGTVGIINQPAITSVLDRVQGFREAIARYPDMKIVADVNGQGVRDMAMRAASDLFQAHPDINGIFGINDDSALGALDAARQGKRMTVAIIGYDATPPAVDAIVKETQLKADVIQYPKKIGATTIRIIRDYFSGKKVAPIVPVDVGIVDKTTLKGSSTLPQ
jgi:ribose transport system substrate-binding protein